jgi:CPA2 family monovalent cation:H+ antiporter-2
VIPKVLILEQYLFSLVGSSFQFSFLVDLVVLILSALAFSLLFARLRVSIVAGQILAGVIVGPYVLGWVTGPVVLNQLAEVGVVLLLFIIGLELDPAELRRVITSVTSLTILEIAIAFAFGLIASYLLKFTLLEAVIFSMGTSITSTAIVGKIFLSRRILRTPESGFLIGLLVVEDMIAVVFLIVLSSITSTNIASFPYYVVGASASSKGFLAALEAILGGFALIALAYGVSHYVAPTIINHLSHFEEEFEEIPFLFALGLGFLFAVIAALFGFSPGTGAFIVGLSIRGKQSKFLSERIAPIKDLFLVLFFVSMGGLINPFPALQIGWPIILTFVLLIIGKFAGGFSIGKILHRQKDKFVASSRKGKFVNGDRLASPTAFGSWLIPRGEFSLIIGQLALALSLIISSFFSLIGFSVLVTTMVGSIILRYVEPKKALTSFPIRGHKDEE